MADPLLKGGFAECNVLGFGNGYPDGRAHFGLTGEGTMVALDCTNRGEYGRGVIEVGIPKAEFDRWIRRWRVGSRAARAARTAMEKVTDAPAPFDIVVMIVASRSMTIQPVSRLLRPPTQEEARVLARVRRVAYGRCQEGHNAPRLRQEWRGVLHQ